MKSLKRAILRWLVSSNNNSEDENDYNMDAMARPRKLNSVRSHGGPRCDDELETECTFTMSIFDAIGGKVVECRKTDRRRDERTCTVYIIPSTDVLGERLEKILTLEALK